MNMAEDRQAKRTGKAKDPMVGLGARGVPQYYYTTRELPSNARYEKFITKLRATDQELRKQKDEALKKADEKFKQAFFARCQRKNLLLKVEERFKFCIKAYEHDLNVKREKLKNLYEKEEQEYMQMLVHHVYDGREGAWQDSTERLEHLLAKRQIERDEKYAIRSKCIHALPLLREQQTKETVKIWGHQIQEKESRKMADKEFDKMWHDVLMSQTEALTARMEMEAIGRFRRDLEAKEDIDRHLAIRRAERVKLQDMLKRETLELMAKFRENNLQDEKEKRERQELRQQRVEEINEMVKERRETVSKRKDRAKIISDVWLSLGHQGVEADNLEKQRRKKQQRNLLECNQKLSEQKYAIAKQKEDHIPLVLEEYNRIEEATFQKREQLAESSKKLEMESRQAIVEQIKEKEENEKARLKEKHTTLEYNRQVKKQLQELVKHKELTDTQANKLYYKDLKGQMEYNKILKERAQREAEKEYKRCQIATQQYEDLISAYRPKYVLQHPFRRHLSTVPRYETSALKTKQNCPCGPSVSITR